MIYQFKLTSTFKVCEDCYLYLNRHTNNKLTYLQRKTIFGKRFFEGVLVKSLIDRITSKEATVGVIGLGYVGLPLVMEFCRNGFRVTGFDIDPQKVRTLKAGRSYISHILPEKIQEILKTKRMTPSIDFSGLKTMDCIIICVPTPLNLYREPDISYIQKTTETISKYLRKGQLIVLESTTYPGTTVELMKPILEKNGLKASQDFYLAFSPEREDPANKNFSTKTIPKIVGGIDPQSLKHAQTLYEQIVAKVIPVSSTQTAEATKLLENIFRAVNIALVNELKMCFDRMDINIWEVIHAASTKPFGFMPFYPGPGLGGHCIPIDPFYLTWKAREYEFPTKFIELAGEINSQMPYYVVQKTMEALSDHHKSLKGSRILILGLAYKKDIDDIRESPSLKLIEIFSKKGARIAYNDPFVPQTPEMRHYHFKLKSVPLTAKNLKQYDAIVIATDHSAYNYQFIADHAQLVIDTRNATKAIERNRSKIVKA